MTLPGDMQHIVSEEKRRTKRPKRPRKCKPESWVKDGIKKTAATEAPESWWYMPVQGPEGEHGIPDHVGCVPVTITPEMVGRRIGLFVAIEAKADDGTVSALQQVKIKAINDAQGQAHVVTGPAGIEWFRNWLRDLVKGSLSCFK